MMRRLDVRFGQPGALMAGPSLAGEAAWVGAPVLHPHRAP